MRTRKDLIIALENAIDSMNDYELFDLVNEYRTDNAEHELFYMEDFDSKFRKYTPLEMVEIASDSVNFECCDEFFTFDEGWNELTSYSELADAYDYDELIDAIIENECDYMNVEICGILEDFEEELQNGFEEEEY